jgi:Fe-S cluster assembly iron-binding protein IscA
MLTLTPTAAQAVQYLVAGMDVDETTGGLRIASGETTATGPSLELSLVNGPEATDREVRTGGARVFVEPLVSEVLDDKILDARLDGDQVHFVLAEQDPSA